MGGGIPQGPLLCDVTAANGHILSEEIFLFLWHGSEFLEDKKALTQQESIDIKRNAFDYVIENVLHSLTC